MSIILKNKDGVLLKTAGKYCPEDIIVVPQLQTKTVTSNGKVIPDANYAGLSEVTVNVPATPTQEKTITITENGTQEVAPDSGKVLSKVTVTTNVDSGLAIKGLVEQYTVQAGETISAGNFVEWITSIGDGSAMFATAELIDASTVLLTTTTTLQILKISNNAISIGTQLTFTSVCACKFSSSKVVAITNGNTIKLYNVNNTTLEEVSNITSTNISSTGAIVCLDNNNLVTVFNKSENSINKVKTVLINVNGATITDYLLTDVYNCEYSTTPLRLLKLDNSHIFVAGNYGYYASTGAGPGWSPGPRYYSYFATCIIDTTNKTSSKIAGTTYSESYRNIESLRYSNNVVIGKSSSYIIKISISDTYSISVSTTTAITNMKGMMSISDTRILTTVNNNICIYDVSNTTATLVSSKSFSDDSSATGYSISYLNNSNYLLCFKIGTSYYFKTVTINNDEIEFPNSPYTKIIRAVSNNVPVGIAAQSGVGGDIINVYVPTQLWLSAPQISIADNTISWNAVENAVDYEVYDNNTLISTQTSTTYSLTNLSYGSHKIAVKALATTEYDVSPQSNILDFIWNIYNVTTNLTNITANTSNPTTVSTVASSTLIFTANTGYNLPDNVTVTGAEFTWTKSSGTLVLSNPTGDVSVTIAGVAISYTITPTLTNVTAASGNATTIATGETKTLTYTADGYTLPDTVTVTGATGIWNKDSGTLTLSNPTANVTFTITGEAVSSGYKVTVNYSTYVSEQGYIYDGQNKSATSYRLNQGANEITIQSGYAYVEGDDPAGSVFVGYFASKPTVSGDVLIENWDSSANNGGGSALFKVNGTGVINIEFQCFVEGTLITLADGSTKPVEDIDYTDDILVWDFDNGVQSSAKPCWIAKPNVAPCYWEITLSDGTVLKLVGANGKSHRLFNSRGKFVYPQDFENSEQTVKQDGSTPYIVKCEKIYKEVKYYNFATDRALNNYANGVLCGCRFSNVYPIENMKYVKDDRTLATREEYKEIPDKLFYGLRLAEQQNLNDSPDNVNYYHTMKEHVIHNYIEHERDYTGNADYETWLFKQKK